MARVTVEDCRKYIPNRFELSLIAGYRAKSLMAGAEEILENTKNEKFPVIALREIEDNLLDIDVIREKIKTEVGSQLINNNFINEELAEIKKVEKPAVEKAFDLESALDDISDEEDEKEEKELMFAGDNVETKD